MHQRKRRTYDSGNVVVASRNPPTADQRAAPSRPEQTGRARGAAPEVDHSQHWFSQEEGVPPRDGAAPRAGGYGPGVVGAARSSKGRWSQMGRGRTRRARDRPGHPPHPTPGADARAARRGCRNSALSPAPWVPAASPIEDAACRLRAYGCGCTRFTNDSDMRSGAVLQLRF
jgi:hypothetical protein